MSDEFVCQLNPFFAARQLAIASHRRTRPGFAGISTDDQFQFGIRTFLAGLNAHP